MEKFNMTRNLLAALLLFGLLSCGGTDRETHPSEQPGMCAKEEMAADGIVRLSKIEVWPQFLDEYMKYAMEVGEISLRTEPGVLTMPAHRTGCADHVCCGRKGKSLQDNHSRNIRQQGGLRQTHRFRTFPEIQARDAAHGQIIGAD